jgi:hypothetical protein
VPSGTSRQTVRRSERAGWAHYSYCAAYSRWYWGLKLYLVATPEGMPAAWCLADPKLGERDVAAEFLAHARDLGALRDQMIVLCGKGLAGREMERYAAEQVRVLLARPDRKDERRRFGNLAAMRQWIEAIRHPQRPARPGTTRRPHPRGRVHPHRPAAAGPGRRHLAQLTDRRQRQVIPDRLRPLSP